MENQAKGRPETIILGGGCFWCTEAVFQGLRGVLDVVPGYCGGPGPSPSYAEVCTGTTGHVEVVQVTFDADEITLPDLLEVFFATHDPSTPDRQGNDVGPQYASVIFVHSAAQRAQAQAAIERARQALGVPVVTQVREAMPFWPAEAEHLDYYARHPWQGYCQYVIAPKLNKLRQHFGKRLREG